MVIAMLVNIYTGASVSGGRCKQARVKPNSPTKSKRLRSEPLRSLSKQKVRPQTSRQLTSVESKEVNSGKFILYYLFCHFRKTRNNCVSALRYFNRLNQGTRKSIVLYKRPEIILRTVMRYVVRERMTSHQF